MKNKTTIYSNYDLWDDLAEDAKAGILADHEEWTEDDIPEDKIWDHIYCLAEDDWYNVREELKGFFKDKLLIAVGSVGRWNGTFAGGMVGMFDEIFMTLMKDCDYWELADEAGAFTLRCSHHDGTNECEFKVMSEKGKEYYDNWNYGGCSDTRTEQYVHKQIFERYSTLPHFAKCVYGTPEYVKKPKSEVAA